MIERRRRRTVRLARLSCSERPWGLFISRRLNNRPANPTLASANEMGSGTAADDRKPAELSTRHGPLLQSMVLAGSKFATPPAFVSGDRVTRKK